MSLQDQGIKWAKLWKQLPQASTGRHLWLCGQGPFLGQGSAPWRLLVSDAYLTCIPQCWPRAWLGSKWLLERLDNNFEKHQCFLFFFFFFIYSLKLLWDHQRVCFHTVEHTSPTELTRALELSWNSFRHPGGGLWVGGLWVSLPKKKHCFLSVFHVGLLCKIYQREGSTPQINLKTIVRRLERHCQHGQRGNGFIRQCVWLTSWQKRPFERLWKLGFTGLVLAFLSWLLLLLASHSFACLPSPDALHTGLFVNFHSLSSSLWPGILIHFLLQILATLYFFTLFWLLPGYLVLFLPWPQVTVSQSVFCLPGSWHHLGIFSCHSFPQNNYF